MPVRPVLRPIDSTRLDRVRDAIMREPIVVSSRFLDEVDGVFEGGGALGAAYIGALMALERHRIWFKRVAGTSAGSITAAMIAAGYSARAIAWLTAPRSMVSPNPPSDVPASIVSMAPIRFSTFIDVPSAPGDIPIATKRRTALWNMVNGTVIDDFRNQPVANAPTRSSIVNDITNGVVNLSFGVFAPFRAQIAQSVEVALGFYPDRQPRVGDFLPSPVPAFRRAVADRVWDAFATRNPWYPGLVNFLYEGGLARGDVFHDTMRRLLGAKVAGNPAADVTFGELPIDLAVIAANTHEGEMAVYSKTRTPGKSVADAVRESMAIPLFFEPRRVGGDEMMDGGLFSNYPFWLYTGGGDGMVGTTGADTTRTKLGFLLNEFDNPPASWGSPAPKWVNSRTGAGEQPEIWQALAENAGFPLPHTVTPQQTELIAIGRILRVMRAIDLKEAVLNRPLRTAAKQQHPFHEVEIPVAGFHWLDFSVNEDAATFAAMAFRAWEATVRTGYFQHTVDAAQRQANPFVIT